MCDRLLPLLTVARRSASLEPSNSVKLCRSIRRHISCRCGVKRQRAAAVVWRRSLSARRHSCTSSWYRAATHFAEVRIAVRRGVGCSKVPVARACDASRRPNGHFCICALHLLTRRRRRAHSSQRPGECNNTAECRSSRVGTLAFGRKRVGGASHGHPLHGVAGTTSHRVAAQTAAD